MADDTLGQTRLCLLRVGITNWSFQITTLAAEVHLTVLGEHLGALSDHTSELDQSVEMDLAQFTELILNGQVIDPHKDLLMEVRVVGEDF